ncbi:ribosome maturation factor RimP [Camelliibacillus cellulosilyticus]|uniref:Ribosome maturation factor RimP n=1 Tax=Camelliibacillus cellulosilyticus TaxID=2174486 RepID=A0ABV9GL43_9BACL
MAGKVTEIATGLIEPILQDLNLELVDVQYVKEGKNWILRVFIDSPVGVDLDTCTRVSDSLSEALDENDPIKDPYFLEVSSPGAERPLKNLNDYKKAVGKHVRITTYEAIDGDKVFEGQLKLADDKRLTVSIKNKTKVKDIDIPLDKIASARLAIVF